MPGKINPVIPEAVNQVAYQVIGNDLAVTLAAEAGQLQLNAMEPGIVFNILQSIDMLSKATNMLGARCVAGISANREHCRSMLDRSHCALTALNPQLGYDRASHVARMARESGRSAAEIIVENNWMSSAELADVLDPTKVADAVKRRRAPP